MLLLSLSLSDEHTHALSLTYPATSPRPLLHAVPVSLLTSYSFCVTQSVTVCGELHQYTAVTLCKYAIPPRHCSTLTSSSLKMLVCGHVLYINALSGENVFLIFALNILNVCAGVAAPYRETEALRESNRNGHLGGGEVSPSPPSESNYQCF